MSGWRVTNKWKSFSFPSEAVKYKTCCEKKPGELTWSLCVISLKEDTAGFPFLNLNYSLLLG